MGCALFPQDGYHPATTESEFGLKCSEFQFLLPPVYFVVNPLLASLLQYRYQARTLMQHQEVCEWRHSAIL
jgi:hypothetical protein